MDTAALYPLDARRAYRTKHTRIGNDVWIGYHATIVGGAAVGDGAVIASHSVVFSDVPAFAVVAGNPATIVRYRFSRSIAERLLRIAWWDYLDDEGPAGSSSQAAVLPYVSVGRPIDGVDLIIVDGTGNVCSDREMGELFHPAG